MNWNRFVSIGVFVVSAAMVTLTAPPVHEAEAASVTLRYGVDYPGNDFAMHRGVSMGYCQQLCLNNRSCAVFTYNTRNRYCFLKHRAGYVDNISYAVSGLVHR